MSRFAVVTKQRQALYEKLFTEHKDLNNDIPEICGFYGRACRKMDREANSMPCTSCSLSVFTLTVEAILARCDEKEALGIKSLHDSDIYDIQDDLKAKAIRVSYSYVEKILDYLVEMSPDS